MPTRRSPGPRQPQARTVRPKRNYGAPLAASSRRRPRVRHHTLVGLLLLFIAVALVPTHLAEHAGVFDPLPGKLEDLFLGFPAAGLLGIAGFIAFILRE